MNSGKFDRARSTYGPPGVPRLFRYAKTRKLTGLHAIAPPPNSLDSGGVDELSSPFTTDCYSNDNQHAPAKRSRSGELVSRASSSRKFTTVLCPNGLNLSCFPLQPNDKSELNQLNYGEVIITRREHHWHEGGDV